MKTNVLTCLATDTLAIDDGFASYTLAHTKLQLIRGQIVDQESHGGVDAGCGKDGQLRKVGELRTE